MTDGTEYGCLDCIGLGHYRTFQVEDEHEAFFCPYCGNQSFIKTGPEWQELLDQDGVQ